MKKRLVTVALVAIMAVVSAFAFLGCGNDDKDSAPADTFYKGTLSSESYTTSNDAAKAFLQNEVNGDVTTAVFESYAKENDLTEDEIAALEISEADKANIASAEKGTVSYTVANASPANVYAGASAETKTVKVYVIKFGATYKYYAPELKTGDVVTKSYYDEVFSAEKYVNCTMKTVSKSAVTMTVEKQSVETVTTLDMTMKVAGRYAYATCDMKVSALGMTQPLGSYEMFFVFEENQFSNNFDVYMKTEGSDWMETDMSYVDSDIDVGVKPDMDYSYFVKTKSGFKINTEKFEYYLAEILEDMEDSVEISTPSIKANAEYFVKDGILTKTVVTMSGNVTASGVSGKMKTTATATYSDFGTTTVTVPNDLTLPD